MHRPTRIGWRRKPRKKESRPFHIFSHRKVLDVLTYICQQILPKHEAERIGSVVLLHELHDGDRFQVGDMQLQCFDIHSTKELQYGFTALLPDGQRLVCLGDEPYCEDNEKYESYPISY